MKLLCFIFIACISFSACAPTANQISPDASTPNLSETLRAAGAGDSIAQYNLGLMYARGDVVPQDFRMAHYFWEKAALKGYPDAQYNLGVMYERGDGVIQNSVQAYSWYLLAASKGFQEAIYSRDILAGRLLSAQIREAQQIASDLSYKIDHPHELKKESPPPEPIEKKEVVSSGTGFIVTANGYILTCHHVVNDAANIQVSIAEKIYKAKLVREDPANDLALLKVDGSFSALAFSLKSSVKMGQRVFTIGYPNPLLQGINAKFTEGTISSLTGFQDDVRLIQISVPVQPGNSGGALLDESGNVVGIVVAGLDAQKTFTISGSIPQNVNYAIKSIYAKALFDTIPEINDSLISPSNSKASAIDRAEKSMVLIISYSK